jgi:hypothetical protein
MKYISGEKIQQLCDIYCGNSFHLNRNPVIQQQTHKHLDLDQLHTEFDNPTLVFCYSQCLDTLMSKLHLFKNQFVLVSHNEDTNITEHYKPLADSPKISKWFAQNLMITHPKVHFLPIGIANSMWPHGNLHLLDAVRSISKENPKTKDVLFNFRLSTNPTARHHCYNVLTSKGLQFTQDIPHEQCLQEMAKSKFFISPDGNGIDCHRIWEGYALGSIPILLKSTFSLHLQSILPCILLNSWNDFTLEACLSQYDELKSKLDKNYTFTNFETYKGRILQAVYDLTHKTETMNNVFCFIGNLPSYALDTVHQLRLFTQGPIYFIVSDISIPLVYQLKNAYNITIIPYNEVEDTGFTSLIQTYFSKFCIVNTLKGRERLFICAFERFYLLSNLIKKYALEHTFFIELDNLIYDDPTKWLSMFQRKEMAFMFDNVDRYASGVCYVKQYNTLDLFLDLCTNYIMTSKDFLNEMSVLSIMRQKYPDQLQMLPILWKTNQYPLDVHEHFGEYGQSLFDAAAIGIYLGGMDPHHTNGVIVKGLKTRWGLIDYTSYTYEWKVDEQGRKIPYIWSGTEWLKINNLHIHSKDLKSCLSKE